MVVDQSDGWAISRNKDAHKLMCKNSDEENNNRYRGI